VARTNVLQDAWARGQKVSVHGWCYGLKDGLVKDLNVTMSSPNDVMAVFRQALKRYPRASALGTVGTVGTARTVGTVGAVGAVGAVTGQVLAGGVA
jgi:hypothetical protein